MDFFTTTEFMTELGLDLREQTAFAIIYSFSQDREGCWYGSINNLGEWLGNCSVPTTINTLKKLVEKGLVEKAEYLENGVKRCRYTTSKKIIEGYLKNLSGGTKISLDNIRIDKSILKKNKKDNKGAAPSFDFFGNLLSLGVAEQTARDWMEVRRAKRGVNTRSALDDVLREIRKAGISVQDGIAFAAAHSWRGFNASWYQNAKAEESSPKAPSFTPARKPEKVTIDDMIHRYCGGNNTDLDLDEQ